MLCLGKTPRFFMHSSAYMDIDVICVLKSLSLCSYILAYVQTDYSLKS